jgi:mono/diheme cytochrome c family protein
VFRFLNSVSLLCLHVAGLVLLLTACDRKPAPKTEIAKAGDPARGRRVYLANCTVCHNPDPAKDGSLGPAVKGSSQSLVEARVVSGGYPPGYTPKRKTLSMPTYAYLKSEVPHLTAFLQTAALGEKDQKEQVKDQGQNKARP